LEADVHTVVANAVQVDLGGAIAEKALPKIYTFPSHAQIIVKAENQETMSSNKRVS
jgi:hypothetical protein